MPADRDVRRLLLIHRDPDLATRIRNVLTPSSRYAFRVASYTHLVDALTYCKVNPVDLIVVGPEPADRSQQETVAELGARLPEVPLVALLARSNRRGAERLLAAGATDWLAEDDLNSELWARTLEFCHRTCRLNAELARATARLDWLMHQDSLTGLLNHKGMERVMMQELARCRERNVDLQVLLVDLDDFTKVNATLGHGVGDLVLVSAARRITESIRTQDQVGRCGTDRFVIILPEADAAEAEIVAEKIRLAVGRDLIHAGEHTLSTTASLGLTAIKASTQSFDEVLAMAHFALQHGKLQGKNQVVKAASVEALSPIRPAESGPDLVRALLRDPVFQVASQPIVNLADGRIVSREMLVRGPAGPLRNPDSLFRFCQEQDILTAVDLRCLRSCAAAAARLEQGVRFHVNIMPATLLQTPVDELVRVLRVNGNYGHCCLEISEQQILGDPSVLVPRVKMLQQAGIRVAVDDVGYGNSGLEGLIMLQPQVMKIDKRMIRGLAADGALQTSLTRLLAVAEVLQAEVVAEGIENADDYRVLLELGVRYGQGYLFGRPRLCDEETPRADVPRGSPRKSSLRSERRREPPAVDDPEDQDADDAELRRERRTGT